MNCAGDFFGFDRNHHDRDVVVRDARIADDLNLIDSVNMLDDRADLGRKCETPCREVLAGRNEEVGVEGIVHPFLDGTVEGMCESTETDHHRQRKHECRYSCGSPPRCFDEAIGRESSFSGKDALQNWP